jgi:oligopeptide transport system ATP-binding protein
MGRLLDVKDLHVSFTTKFGQVNAVNGVSFHIDEGEIVGVVGESGSGKSVMCMSLLRLIAKNGRIKNGEIIFRGTDLTKCTDQEIQKLRGSQISMIFQDPMTCLNPVFTIGDQLEEVLRFHRTDMTKSERIAQIIKTLQRVDITNPEQRLRQYPHELSGGLRQRVMIAMSLLAKPRLLIADEPTTALDVTIEAQIMDLIRELSAETGTSVILITHNLGVVAGLADRVMVMYGGESVEAAMLDEIFYNPVHPYTWGLLNALPKLNSSEKLIPIPGSAPDLLLEHKGCMFTNRCKYAMECCVEEAPPIYEVGEKHLVKCWRCHPDFEEE